MAAPEFSASNEMVHKRNRTHGSPAHAAYSCARAKRCVDAGPASWLVNWLRTRRLTPTGCVVGMCVAVVMILSWVDWVGGGDWITLRLSVLWSGASPMGGSAL